MISVSNVSLPTFIGIGAPKAATTWLHACLQQHPDVFMAAVKEINFFAFLDEIDHRLDEYTAHFAGASTFAARGEISTGYLVSPTAPERVKRHLGSAKLIVSLRDPLEQINSHYWHLRRQNFHKWEVGAAPLSLRQAVERYPEALIEPARYCTHMKRWLALFPREQFHVILYDDVRADPQAVLRELFAFVGVDPNFVPGALNERGSDVRRGSSPRGPATDRLYAHTYNLLNRFIYHPMKRSLGNGIANRIKDRLRIRQTLEAIFYRPGYTPLGSADRDFLHRALGNEIEQLEDLLQIDLSRWKSDG